MNLQELQAAYARVLGEACTTRHKERLVRRIAWVLQARAEGGLSKRARRRAMELARETDLRLTAPPAGRLLGAGGAPAARRAGTRRLPRPGSILTRVYKGRVVEVAVLRRGYAYGGEIYGSLSAAARAITGSHWNGYLFFGLRREVSA